MREKIGSPKPIEANLKPRNSGELHHIVVNPKTNRIVTISKPLLLREMKGHTTHCLKRRNLLVMVSVLFWKMSRGPKEGRMTTTKISS